MKRLLKQAAERALLRLGPASWARRHAGNRTVVLAYHNVVPDAMTGFGDASLHIAISRFRCHLDAIESIGTIRSLSEPIGERTDRRPFVIVTFDDAYGGVVELAIPELVRRRWPCTIFVPPAFVPNRSFWWDDLADSSGRINAVVRAACLDSDAGRDSTVRQHYALSSRSDTSPLTRCATHDDLVRAAETGLVSFGAHSWSHPNLTRLSLPELYDELTMPLRWVRDRFGVAAVPWLSYPYGLQDETVRRAAREVGYTGAFLVSGGCIAGEGTDNFALPRVNVPAGLSADGLALRLCGLLV